MKSFIINNNEAGQRFDKYLKKLLKEAPNSFLYKMLRKKNIVLNGSKADGSEKLSSGDEVKLYLADETFDKFKGAGVFDDETLHTQYPYQPLDIIYEDKDYLIINKPAGMLSQKADITDISANELVIGYLLHEQVITAESLATFKPSICNRLDRNTSGLLAAGKTLKGLQELSDAFKNRTVVKLYQCLVAGQIHTGKKIKGYLRKSEATNQVTISQGETEGASYIETEYEPIEVFSNATLLSVHLITGRTHQIRAHLASISHPIIGDVKYGDDKVNKQWRKEAKVKRQLLHAYRMVLLDGTKLTAELPPDFRYALEYIKGQ